MKSKIYSKRFKGVLLWEGETISEKTIDVKKTDNNIQTILDEKFFRWLDENPGIEEMPEYLDEKEIIQHKHWLETAKELCRECSPLIVWTNRDRFELEVMLKEADLFDRIKFRVTKNDDGTKTVAFWNDQRCVALSKQKALEVLEDSALSTNHEEYFWQLAYRKLRPLL